MDLAHWVQANGPALGERWLSDVQTRSGDWTPEVRSLMERFVQVFMSLLPGTLGPLRAPVEAVWMEAAELYGSVAAMRGLAAGEVIEEFQVLREILIRAGYHRPPQDGVQPVALREILRLNRIVDRGVARASIGHTDAMFFALFQGSGMPPALTPEIMDEVDDQLSAIVEEGRTLLGGTAGG